VGEVASAGDVQVARVLLDFDQMQLHQVYTQHATCNTQHARTRTSSAAHSRVRVRVGYLVLLAKTEGADEEAVLLRLTRLRHETPRLQAVPRHTSRVGLFKLLLLN
jgi:hypothetical protein